MMKIMVVAILVAVSGCIGEDNTPFAGPLWGDACKTDKGQGVVSGCVHVDDGSGNQGFGGPRSLGICAPPTSDTVSSEESWRTDTGYTGACRPFCDSVILQGGDRGYACPDGGVPTFEIHGIANGYGHCYCSDPDVDQMFPDQLQPRS